MTKRRWVMPLLLAFVVALSLQGTAWAPRVHGLPNYEGPCSVAGQAGTFTGAIFVRDYEATGDDVVALLSVTGTCTVGSTEFVLNDAQTSSAVTVEKSNCAKLILRLDSATSGEMVVDLSAATMTSRANSGDRSAFCELARLLRSGPDAARVAAALSEFFSTVS